MHLYIPAMYFCCCCCSAVCRYLSAVCRYTSVAAAAAAVRLRVLDGNICCHGSGRGSLHLIPLFYFSSFKHDFNAPLGSTFVALTASIFYLLSSTCHHTSSVITAVRGAKVGGAPLVAFLLLLARAAVKIKAKYILRSNVKRRTCRLHRKYWCLDFMKTKTARPPEYSWVQQSVLWYCSSPAIHGGFSRQGSFWKNAKNVISFCKRLVNMWTRTNV